MLASPIEIPMGTDSAISPQKDKKSSQNTIIMPPSPVRGRCSSRSSSAGHASPSQRLMIRSIHRKISISVAPSGTAAYGMLMCTPKAGDSWFRFSKTSPTPSRSRCRVERLLRGRSPTSSQARTQGGKPVGQDGDREMRPVLHRRSRLPTWTSEMKRNRDISSPQLIGARRK